MDGNTIGVGCFTVVACAVVSVLLYGAGIFFYDSFNYKEYCAKCGQLLTPQADYCPNCGSKTDTVNVCTFWQKRKLENDGRQASIL